jgi:hypothetical protein
VGIFILPFAIRSVFRKGGVPGVPLTKSVRGLLFLASRSIHVQAALEEFPLHLLRGDLVLGEDLRILRQTKSDKAGIVHHVEDVGKACAGKGVPQIGASANFMP